MHRQCGNTTQTVEKDTSLFIAIDMEVFQETILKPEGHSCGSTNSSFLTADHWSQLHWK